MKRARFSEKRAVCFDSNGFELKRLQRFSEKVPEHSGKTVLEAMWRMPHGRVGQGRKDVTAKKMAMAGRFLITNFDLRLGGGEV